MMKWFRKHNKQLLAVFASALLVIWLGGSAFEKLFQRDPYGDTFGTAMGKKITGAQMGSLKARLNVMEFMRLPWSAPWINEGVQKQLALPDREAQMVMMAMGEPFNRDKGVIDWWLLDMEARNMGVIVSQQQAKDFLAKRGMTGSDLEHIRDNSSLATAELYGTAADYLRVTQAALLASAGIQVSEPEIKDVFIKTHDQLNVRYAILPAETFEAPADSQPADGQIPEADLEALFAKYRDQMAGTGEYGFGYKIPDRETIQYAGGSVAEIAVTMPPVPNERARKFFEQHKEEFAPAPPASTQPTTQPVVTFDEVKEKVVERIRNQEASRMLSQAVEEIRSSSWVEFAGAKGDLAKGEVPPILAKAMQQQTEQLSQSKRIPLVYKEIGPVSQEQARNEPGIGIAGSPGAQGQPVEFAVTAFNLTTDLDAKENRGEEKLVKITRYQPVVVRNQSGEETTSMYVYRVTSFEPAHAPASLAEVRQQVLRDARTLRALKKAEEAAQKLAQAAQSESLAAVFDGQFESTAKLPATTQPYGNGPKILEQPTLTRAQYVPAQNILQFEAMRKMYNVDMQGPTELASTFRLAGVTKPSALIDAAFGLVGPATATQPVNKVAVVELPDQKAWAVIQVIEHTPAKQSDYYARKDMIARDLRTLKLRDFYNNWFDAAQIRARMGWKPAQESAME